MSEHLPRPILSFFEETAPERVGDITWDVDLIDTGILDSLHFAALVFHLEGSTGQEIDLSKLTIDTFRTVRCICHQFFPAAASS